jgi:hypothetical protein
VPAAAQLDRTLLPHRRPEQRRVDEQDAGHPPGLSG